MSNSLIPVFPLSTVVFPGHTLPLKLFESRYLELLKDCESAGRREFVIALISSGYEVSDNATPYRVGTLVQYANFMKSDDLVFVSPVGVRRVYLDKFFREEKPYLCAQMLDYKDEDENLGSANNGLDSIERKLSQMWISGGSVHSKEAYSKLLVKKSELSRENYSLYLAGCLELPPMHKQNLLESRTEAYRVKNLLHLLTSKLKTEG